MKGLDNKLKFIAWDYNEKKMSMPFTFEDVDANTVHDNDMYHFDLDECEILQFSGLTDDNKQEIYSGHILEHHTFAFNKETKKYDIPVISNVLVEYSGDGFYANKIRLSFYIRNGCKIIGNKFQNEELLVSQSSNVQ